MGAKTIEPAAAKGIKQGIEARVQAAFEAREITHLKVAEGFKRLMSARKRAVFWSQREQRPVFSKSQPDNEIRLQAHKEVAAILGMYPAAQAPTIDLPDIQFVLQGVDRDRLRGMDGFARLRAVGDKLLPGQTQAVELDLDAGSESAVDSEAQKSDPESEAPALPGVPMP